MGRLVYLERTDDVPEYTDCLFVFENGNELAYVAPRKLGRIALTDSTDAFVRDEGLGPDFCGLSEADFLALATEHRGGVKPWLMNQEIIAGLGNVYSDEALFQAGIHPRRRLSDLDAETVRGLYRALRSVIEAAIEAGAKPDRMPAQFLLLHRKPGGRCPKCGRAVQKTKAAGRSAWFCPSCQR